MPDHKDILLKELSQAGWEQVESRPVSEWWGSEVWLVRSVAFNWGFELFLSFMNDPYPGSATGDPVWLVEVTRNDPRETANTPKLGCVPTKLKQLKEALPDFLAIMDGLRRAVDDRSDSAEQAAAPNR